MSSPGSATTFAHIQDVVGPELIHTDDNAFDVRLFFGDLYEIQPERSMYTLQAVPRDVTNINRGRPATVNWAARHEPLSEAETVITHQVAAVLNTIYPSLGTAIQEQWSYNLQPSVIQRQAEDRLIALCDSLRPRTNTLYDQVDLIRNLALEAHDTIFFDAVKSNLKWWFVPANNDVREEEMWTHPTVGIYLDAMSESNMFILLLASQGSQDLLEDGRRTRAQWMANLDSTLLASEEVSREVEDVRRFVDIALDAMQRNADRRARQLETNLWEA